MKHAASIALTLCVLVSLAWAPASAGKAYLGGSAGQTEVDLGVSDLDDGSLTSASVDDSDSTWKVFGGFRFLKVLGIEGAFVDLGEFSIAGISDGMGGSFLAGPVRAVAEGDGLSVALVGRIPLGRFSIFGKAGVFAWDATTMVTNREDLTGTVTIEREKDDGTDPVYGVGVQYDLERFGLRLEYEQFRDIGDIDVDFLSVGAMFRF